LFQHHTASLVFNDAAQHTTVRRLIVGALTVRAIAAMEPGLETLVDSLLDAAEARGTIDAIDDFAAAIPVEVIGNLLDIPHADRTPLRDWSLAILGALEPVLTEQQISRGNQAVREFTDYLRVLVAGRRRRPGDPAKDVLTRLIRGEGDDRLDEMTLLQNCIFILNAGHETTTNLIGNALEALLRFPDQRNRLLAEPGLIRDAVEEFLRFESSNQLGNRLATAPATIGGVAVAPGTYITLCIGAANRDPAVFAEPDQLDLGRQPNRHLAFGLGVHQCAGLTLARLEARVAIQRFVTRFPRYQLAGPPIRGGRARFRGFLALPMRVT
jgi:cytochrome P450